MADANEIIAAQVPHNEHLFVVGSCDSRITFYSQQVRALRLVDALVKSGHLADQRRFAVVGAGAAGLTVAAALGLAIPDSHIDIFEREETMMHLQVGCVRRNLHPHIYEWPLAGSQERKADLPVLAWRAGSASEVANTIAKDFRKLSASIGNLHFKPLHGITGIRRMGTDYNLSIARYGNKSRAIHKESSSYHAVFLAVGFGKETGSIGQLFNKSYWSDTGVPDDPKTSSNGYTALISGNGDGGLIDFTLACINPKFGHSDLIDLVTSFPSISLLTQDLIEIDGEAKDAQKRKVSYDIFAEYDKRIYGTIKRIGLLADIKGKLRDRSGVTLHTRRSNIFKLETSILNRLLAYTTMRASGNERSGKVNHVTGDIEYEDTGATGFARKNAAKHLLRIDGTRYSVDNVYLRHGTNNEDAFQGFRKIGKIYKRSHIKWLEADPARSSQPSLPTSVHEHFSKLVASQDTAKKTGSMSRQHETLAQCPIPHCGSRETRPYLIDDGEPIQLCDEHCDNVRTGKLNHEILRTIRDWLNPPATKYQSITTREELLELLAEQITKSAGSNMRLTYVGPIVLHPSWYHTRHEKTYQPEKNPERILYEHLLKRSHAKYGDVKFVFRNVPRYSEKISALLVRSERLKFVDDTLANMEEIWPENGKKGPDLICLETGFFRHPFIFSKAFVDVVRGRPEAKTEKAMVHTQSEYVQRQRELFDEMFAISKPDITSQLAELRSFITGIF